MAPGEEAHQQARMAARIRPASGRAAQADDHLDPVDLGPGRRARQAADADLLLGDVGQLTAGLVEKW